jgi:hypothetical protein
MTTAQLSRLVMIGTACALASPPPAAAQSGKLESAYVVLGGAGAIARAIVSDATTCPAITIGADTQPMRARAKPDAAFSVLVCEAAIPAGTVSAVIAGRTLMTPEQNGADWTLSFITANGRERFSCRVKPTEALCK